MSGSSRDLWEVWYEQHTNRAAVSVAKSQCRPGNEPMAAKKIPGLGSPCNIHLHSKRHRLIDVDNLYGKACIDGLRHAGFIKDDSPQYIARVIYTQEKIGKGEQEETIITIEEV